MAFVLTKFYREKNSGKDERDGMHSLINGPAGIHNALSQTLFLRTLSNAKIRALTDSANLISADDVPQNLAMRLMPPTSNTPPMIRPALRGWGCILNQPK